MTPRFPIRIACAAVLAASFGLTGSAFAASKTGTLNVKLTIVDGCSVFSNNTDISLDFGTWTTLSQNIDESASFDVACTGDKGFRVGLGNGSGGGTTVNDRKLTSGPNKIAYNLYTDAGRGTVWDLKDYPATTPATAPGVLTKVNIFGRVPASKAIPVAGVYTDTVAITVTAN
ncbi:spore coat U domain-containing protein [Candidatus Phyllobacterium onerii]|uniref:Csu type fimbrial protein n=1 Tax=Candidatus Phyllobacterium onerii TaxID=3020828 RepID=UPI00232CAD0E|nr:spore coat protein U domain-containing protein [Phyllobacterium sp. IY22]